MANCFPPTPINPINDVFLGIFGNNFFPPFNPGFQPADRDALINEKLLQFKLPGGGAFKPIGDPHRNISEMLAPLTGLLGSAFAFFGPLFLILDLIRAIIDILCSLINPASMIAGLVDMFLTVVPPVVALFPPLSSILLALNVVKLVIAIIVALTTAIIAIIDLIVENALAISSLITEGNVAAIDSVTIKICTLLDGFANELAALAPISFILEILDLFMSLGSKFFCATDAACCNTTACPSIIMEPPSGSGTVTSNRTGVTLKDLADPINPLSLPSVLDPPITIPLNTITLGTIPDLDIGPISFPPLDLVPIPDSALESVELVEPSMTITINGSDSLSALADYIVDPKKIPGSSNDPNAATIHVKITNQTTGASITARATAATSNTFSVKADDFSVGTNVLFEIQPDKDALIKLNLIGLGCDDDVRAAAAGVLANINESAPGIAVVSGGNNRSGFEPLLTKMGRPFPRPPGYIACLAAQRANPAESQAQCVADISSAYIEEVKDFALDLVCLGASRTASEFILSKQFVPADGTEFTTISLTVKDINGTALLANFIPNASANEDFAAEFSSTIGTVGPVLFDDTTGTFHASLTSDQTGEAVVTGAFLINGKVCMVPGSSDGFTIVDKLLDVEFTRPGGVAPRRRRQNQYIQSAGGRRR